MSNIKIEYTKFPDGYVILGDCLSPFVLNKITEFHKELHLIVTDPPYNINIADWDDIENLEDMLYNVLNVYADYLIDNSAAYIFGGIGTPNNRPFFKFLSDLENKTQFNIANLITWSKKRAYGVQHNYLFTREEIAYLIKGKDIKKPRVFNVAYLDQLRGYDGYNKKYPAKSPYKRRTSVWSDVTEIMRGKVHKTEKPLNLLKIMIKSSSNKGEVVFDPFAGSGTTALAARALERRFLLVESKREYYDLTVDRLT